VDLSRQLAETLRLHFIERKRDTLARGWSQPPVWLFYNEEGRPLDPSNVRDRVFHKALEKAGLRRIRVHDLRHNAEFRIMPSSMGKSSFKPYCYRRVLQGGT
jgi:integrase